MGRSLTPLAQPSGALSLHPARRERPARGPGPEGGDVGVGAEGKRPGPPGEAAQGQPGRAAAKDGTKVRTWRRVPGITGYGFEGAQSHLCAGQCKGGVSPGGRLQCLLGHSHSLQHAVPRPFAPPCRVDFVVKYLGGLRAQERRLRGLESQVPCSLPLVTMPARWAGAGTDPLGGHSPGKVMQCRLPRRSTTAPPFCLLWLIPSPRAGVPAQVSGGTGTP